MRATFSDRLTIGEIQAFARMTVGASLRGFVIPANAEIPPAYLQLVGPDDPAR